ncbi:MAG: protein-glutamate O-methyltransferase CheR [Eubacterium sp.]|nr:protein-glutamate O-methyltransferase CheR [Eubacterium sp.]
MAGTYEEFKQNFLRLSGIDLNSYKESQMKRRIDNFYTRRKLADYNEFFQELSRNVEMQKEFTSYLTINVSEFYRNPPQWITVENEVYPTLIERFGKRLKIWSAACSTGDEPYTLAMLLAEHIPLSQVEILATDLDDEIMAKAKEGRYIEKSVRGLPKKYRDKYIIPDGNGYVKVSDEIKSRITFKHHDLLKDPYPTGMHLIVCRNVMIYFTEEAKDKIYHKFSDSLVDNGLFFVGSTEQIIGASKYGFKTRQSFFYEKTKE